MNTSGSESDSGSANADSRQATGQGQELTLVRRFLAAARLTGGGGGVKAAVAVVVAALLAGGLAAPAVGSPVRGAFANLRLVSSVPGELTISWDLPDPAPSDYRIMWAEEGLGFLSYRFANEALRGNEYPDGEATSVTLTGLTEGATYKVKARSRYSRGGRNNSRWSGPWSNEATASVSAATPVAPEPDDDQQQVDDPQTQGNDDQQQVEDPQTPGNDQQTQGDDSAATSQRRPSATGRRSADPGQRRPADSRATTQQTQGNDDSADNRATTISSNSSATTRLWCPASLSRLARRCLRIALSHSEPVGGDLSAGTDTVGVVAADSAARGTISDGFSLWDADWFAAELVAGSAYVIEVLGAGAGAGAGADCTLRGPVLERVYDADGTPVAGTETWDDGRDSLTKLTFTPASPGTYFVSVAGEANAAGTGTYILALTAAGPRSSERVAAIGAEGCVPTAPDKNANNTAISRIAPKKTPKPPSENSGFAKANTPAAGAPTITGRARVGETLTAGTAAITDGDGLTSVSYAYQWIRVATDTTETDIGSATAGTYTLVSDDLGATIKVRVTFTDDDGNSETLTSVATGAVVVTLASNINQTSSGTLGVSGQDQGFTTGPNDTGEYGYVLTELDFTTTIIHPVDSFYLDGQQRQPRRQTGRTGSYTGSSGTSPQKSPLLGRVWMCSCCRKPSTGFDSKL